MFDLSSLPTQCSEILKNPLHYINSVSNDDLKQIFFDTQNNQSEKALSFGFATLLCFIIENFTGPSILSNIKPELLQFLDKEVPDTFTKDINLNGEQLNHLVLIPSFIWISFNLMRKYDAPAVWISRCSVVLQKCLTGPSEILEQIILSGFANNEVELAMGYRLFHQYIKFTELLDQYRKDALQFEFELTGILGKRTKFQQESKAQLSLHVINSAYLRDQNTVANTTSQGVNSREISLDEDSHILERSRLDSEHEIPPLTDHELCYLLLEFLAIADRSASETKDEKRIPLLETVLGCKPSYSIVTVALYFKSLVEKKNLYTQQRAALQLESILQEYNTAEPNEQTFHDRLNCFFTIDHPPLFEIRRESGIQLLYIGSARSAANIFIEHKMWDELSLCAQVTKDTQLLYDVLDKEEKTPLILCILGEFKSDKEMLLQAWNQSKEKLSRAQRSLARVYLHKFQWNEAIDSFRKALQMNKLYPDCWFSLGCSLMNIAKYAEAVEAFQEVVSQKSDDAESFSNLAICLQELKRYPEAHKAITQAIRFERKRTKLWENFIIISLNSGYLNDALLGIEEAQKADNKWLNTPLLYEVLEEIAKKQGDLQRFIKVMDLISQNADCGFDFWSIYADICEAMDNYERALEMRNTVIKQLEKDGKVREPAQFKRLVNAAEKLVNTTKHIIDKKRGTIQRIKVLIKKYQDDFASSEDFQRLLALQNVLD